jgi:hypothetical protein
MVKTRVTDNSIFSTYRADTNFLTVRAGSAFHDNGGTIHHVTGGYYHALFNQNNLDYNVAVLRVSSDFDIPVDRAKYVMCLLWYLLLSHLSFYSIFLFQ